MIGYEYVDRDDQGRDKGVTYIPIIISERPGHGNVGWFLASLDRHRTWKIPCVVSEVLEGMLQRRGWELTREWSDEAQEWVEVYVMAAQPLSLTATNRQKAKARPRYARKAKGPLDERERH